MYSGSKNCRLCSYINYLEFMIKVKLSILPIKTWTVTLGKCSLPYNQTNIGVAWLLCIGYFKSYFKTTWKPTEFWSWKLINPVILPLQVLGSKWKSVYARFKFYINPFTGVKLWLRFGKGRVQQHALHHALAVVKLPRLQPLGPGWTGFSPWCD